MMRDKVVVLKQSYLSCTVPAGAQTTLLIPAYIGCLGIITDKISEFIQYINYSNVFVNSGVIVFF